MIGQDEAVTAVAEAVIRARSGLKDPNRPIGSFIFLGPTGVGKTELARALAEFLFDDEQAMIRIDMSEYQEKHTVARLIGAPPGYVGYEEGGQLTEAVRRRPYCVVLFDEIEKAHHGRVQRAAAGARRRPADRRPGPHGRLQEHDRHHDVEHRQPAHPAVSGAASIGEVYDRMKEAVLDELRKHFRPEFLNRVDEIIVFHALTEEHLKQIVDIQLGRLRERLAERHITLELTDAAEDAPGAGRLRPGVRRPAAEAGDPEGGRDAAGPAAARGRGPRRADGRRWTTTAMRAS